MRLIGRHGMTTYKKRDNNPAENRGEQLQEFLRNNVIMNNLQRNTLSQLALGAVEKTDMKAVGLLLGLPPELTVSRSGDGSLITLSSLVQLVDNTVGYAC